MLKSLSPSHGLPAWRITGGSVLVDGMLEVGTVTLAGGLIGAADDDGRELDAGGLLVLPGIIDIHGDAFERQIMPRPNVGFSLEMALAETDRQLAANGITTAYHGVTWSWEPGLRGAANARALLDRLEAMRGRLGVDTRYHLRHEIFNLAGEAEILAWIAGGRIGCIAFNDHMEGTFKARNRPEKVGKMIERSGLASEDFLALVETVYSRRDEVAGSVERLARAAVAAGIPALSHDDMTPDMRRWFRDLGVTIAEFPVTEATARAAAQAGEAIVFGAPNVIRGGSHTGCPTAAEMVRAGLCTVLASDYYYPALLAAPFRLTRDAVCDFATAWSLVSAGPARALGLTDRGVIRPGGRGDVIVVDANGPGGLPTVVATFAGGRLIHLGDGARLGV